MFDLAPAATLAVAGLFALVVVYLWSNDSNRRKRAWRLLKLLLDRRPTTPDVFLEEPPTEPAE